MNAELCTVEFDRLNLPEEDIYRAMGYGDVIPDDSVQNLVQDLLLRTKQVAKPMYYYRILPCAIQPKSITMQGVEFNTENTITKLLKNSERMALFVATAGQEFQNLLDEASQSEDALSLFVLDAIGSTLAEAVGDYMELQLQQQIGTLKHTNRFSPGYCSWNIQEQHKLFSLLPEQVCNIKLSSTSLMHPIKSISGVVGIGDQVLTKKYGCSICKRTDCYLRKI